MQRSIVSVFSFSFIAIFTSLQDCIAAPSPIPIAYTPNIALITSLCTHKNDFYLHKWSYVSGYLLCTHYDEFTGGEKIFQLQSINNFKELGGAGGIYDANQLIEKYKVPSQIAIPLVDGMHL